MKKIPIALFAAFLTFSPVLMSCNSKKEDKTTKEEPKPSVENAPTVETSVPVGTDEELNRGVTDAIKDHPTVRYSLNDGKIVLTGEITKDKWMALKQTLDKLKSKGYDLTGLTIK